MAKTKHLFLTTLFLLAIVFIIGMLLGRWMSSSKVNEIESFIKTNELNTESYLVEQALMENFDQDNCDLAGARILSLSNDLWKIGQSLSPDDAEEKLGSENYRFLKIKYHLMQIRTYVLLHNLNQNCNNTDSVALFYFSKDDELSKKQGEILDRVVKDYGIYVFAVEHNYSEELLFLESHYSITETPALIIDYNTKFSGLASYDQVILSIKNSSNTK